MSIMICTPMYGGICHSAHFLSCLALRGELARVGMDHAWCVLRNESRLPHARNTCVASFLESKHQRLLFVDADVEFRPEDVAALWNAEKGIVVGAYAMKSGTGKVSVWKGGEWMDKMGIARLTELTEVDYGGTGFMMISREVLEGMCEKHEELAYEEDGPRVALFRYELSGGTYMPEDYAFCDLARADGHSIWLDPSVQLKHWGGCAY